MHVARGFRGIVAVGLFLTIVSTATAKYSGGSGTAQDRYQVRTAAEGLSEVMVGVGGEP